jgi:DNA-binding transcriptional LysR family regulator
MKIDFDGVQAFVAIAELGGFSKAARELNITQTALTRRIQKLEGYLGLKLLDRTTRRVDLTVVGREFLPQARSIAMDYQLAKRNLRVHVKYEVQHHATAVNLVAAGVASTILPSSTIREGDRPGIRKIALGGPTVKRRVVLLRARQGSLSPAAEAFHALIRKSTLVL